MAISTLDTHQTVKDLTAAGFTDAQTEALTHALRQVQHIDFSDLATAADVADIRREMATKAELAELRNEMKLEFANVRHEMAGTKTELIKWGPASASRRWRRSSRC